MCNELDRGFKGIWIPKIVVNDSRLSALDKYILVEIDSLDSSVEGCYASNQYLATFCKCSIRQVSRTISKLIKYKYITIRKVDGRKRWIKSKLSRD